MNGRGESETLPASKEGQLIRGRKRGGDGTALGRRRSQGRARRLNDDPKSKFAATRDHQICLGLGAIRSL